MECTKSGVHKQCTSSVQAVHKHGVHNNMSLQRTTRPLKQQECCFFGFRSAGTKDQPPRTRNRDQDHGPETRDQGPQTRDQGPG
jgi:hypothetical protein